MTNKPHVGTEEDSSANPKKQFPFRGIVLNALDTDMSIQNILRVLSMGEMGCENILELVETLHKDGLNNFKVLASKYKCEDDLSDVLSPFVYLYCAAVAGCVATALSSNAPREEEEEAPYVPSAESKSDVMYG